MSSIIGSPSCTFHEVSLAQTDAILPNWCPGFSWDILVDGSVFWI